MIQTEYSWFWLPLLLLVAFGFAFLLYSKKNMPWENRTNWLLASLRFVAVALVAILFLGLLRRQVQNQTEKAHLVFALDNSQSMSSQLNKEKITQILTDLDQLKNDLADKDFEVEIRTFSEKTPQSFTQVGFEAQSSNLHQLLKGIADSYENRNLAGIVLISDGIYNQGISPLYSKINLPIHVLALGDTVPKSDVSLRAVFHNKIAYLGNKFPIIAEIQQIGFQGKEVTVALMKGDKILETKKLILGKDNFPQEVSFLVEATQKGQQRFSIRVDVLPKEFSDKNNSKEIYLEVLDNKEKILLLAFQPHPDLKALKSAIEQNQNYEVEVIIPEVTPINYQNTKKYDLAILHQIPNLNAVGNDILKDLRAKNTPIWYIVGSNSNLTTLNSMQVGAKILSANQEDKVMASFNPNFDKFIFENEKRQFFNNYAPLQAPFGNYSVQSNAQILLYQQVGKIRTERPLLLLHQEENTKNAVLFGEGIWQWRLQEYAMTEKQVIFDEFIQKIVQLLASKDDKRKFRVRSSNPEFLESEDVLFETETYNEIYEKIYGQKIDLVLTDEKGNTRNYTYTNSADNFKYKVSALPSGVYQYKASTLLNGQNEQSTGEFTVKALQLEMLNTTADFGLLRELAQQNMGEFAQNTQEIAQKLLKKEAQGIIRSQEITDDIIHFKEIFFAIFLLIALEWFVRKFKGAY